MAPGRISGWDFEVTAGSWSWCSSSTRPCGRQRDRRNFLKWLGRRAAMGEGGRASRKHSLSSPPKGFTLPGHSSLHDRTFSRTTWEYLFLYRLLTNFEAAGRKPPWLALQVTTSRSLTRYLGQTMDVLDRRPSGLDGVKAAPTGEHSKTGPRPAAENIRRLSKKMRGYSFRDIHVIFPLPIIRTSHIKETAPLNKEKGKSRPAVEVKPPKGRAQFSLPGSEHRCGHRQTPLRALGLVARAFRETMCLNMI